MVEQLDRRYAVTTARADFLEGDFDPRRGAVPDHVAASWRRSVSHGVCPSAVQSPYFDALDFDSRLVRCAEPVMEQLAEQIGEIPMCVALTDGKARILARKDGSRSFARVTDRVYFAAGFGYAEESVGTNGVGTVLGSGRPVHIVGAEHYVDMLQPFACTGAPVHDPFTGRIEGVLDISCFADHSSPVLFSLVRSAAARIERNLVADRNHTQQALFDVYSRAEARTRDAVLAVGPSIVIAGGRMQSLLCPADQSALHDHVRFLMARHGTVDEAVTLPSAARVRLRGTTVGVGDDVAGMVCAVAVLGRPGEPPQDPAPAPCPPAGSPAWRAAEQTVAGAVARRLPVLVQGEEGTGRTSLLRTVLDDARPDGGLVAVGPEEVAADSAAVAARLRDAGPSQLLVLQRADRIPPAPMAALVAALTGDGEPAALAATIGPSVPAGRPYQEFLGLFAVSAQVPALRHRGADLDAVVTAVLADLAPHRTVVLSEDARRVVAGGRWPGNVRQLRDALAEALRNRPVGAIRADDLPGHCRSAPRSTLRPVDQVERDAIVDAIRRAGGNRKAAAEALGLARSTLYRKIRQYGIED
ncbi:sigma-54-dependent Fis family transcriptional regulator [Pseudonocardia phyllosphaerae]|uniref:sigma-54-dependent Fis family transcriptional regulator n=1 Tax=Pseudonocardia phyllosphaerae TaxID=3390502 RepID=UPI00397C9F3F